MNAQRQPYPGLRPFERDESLVFFGREKQVDDLLARLKQRHFLAVLGASGSGKSSLVKAGLLPALAKGYMGEVGTRWSVAELRPGSQAFERLAEGLLKDEVFRRAWLSSDAEPGPQAQAFLAAALRRGARSLHEILAASPLPAGTRLLLVVDQFEELFRYRSVDENQAAAFAALLLEAVKHADIYVVITMRSDFLGRAAEFQGLPEAINNGLYLTPRLTREQLAEAIAKPALLFGGSVEDSLVNALCNEAGHDPDQLPLLQHALMRLWQDKKNLSLDAYRKLGGLQGALDGHAEKAWDNLAGKGGAGTDGNPLPAGEGSAEAGENPLPAGEGRVGAKSEAQRIAELMFRALTEGGSEGQDIRRPATLGEIQALAKLTDIPPSLGNDAPPTPKPEPDEAVNPDVIAVVEAFSQPGRNFLMLSPPGKRTADTTVDISHESLIRQWQRLQAWVKKEADKAAMLKRLSEAASRYQQKDEQGQPMGSLWQKTDLALALKWREIEKPTAVWAGRYLVSSSRSPQEARQNAGTDGPGVQGLPCANPPGDESQAGARQALHSISTHAPRGNEDVAGRATDPQHGSTGFPRGAWEPEPAAVQAFQQAMAFLDASDTEEQRLIAEKEAERQEKIRIMQEAEQRLAKSLFDSKLTHASLLARTEDYAGAKELLKQTRDLDSQVEANRRHARDLLAGFALIMGGEAAQTYTGAGVPLPGNLALSPDGHWLAAGGEQGKIALFERESGKLSLLQGHQAKADDMGAVFGIAFHPRQPWLYSGGADGRILRWQLPQAGQAAQLLQSWLVEGGAVNSLALNPGGEFLASGHSDGGIQIWQSDNGQKIRHLRSHGASIAARSGLVFSPDGRLLASASYDNTARLWNWRKGRSLRVLKGHTDSVHGIAFSHDGRLLATSSGDRSIKLWDLGGGQSLRTLLGHSDTVWGLQFLPGNRLASASDDRTIRLWDLDTGITLRVLQGHAAGVGGLALPAASEPAAMLYSASKDGTVKRWNLVLPGQWLLPLPSEPASAAIAPDGRRLVVGYADGSLRVYALPDSETGRLLELPHKPTAAHGGKVKRLAFDASGMRLASAGFDHLAKLWGFNSDGILTEEKTLAGHQGGVHGLDFSPDGQRLATASYDGRIGLFDLRGESKPPFAAHEGIVAAVSFAPDGRSLLSAGEDRQLKLWDLANQPPRWLKTFPEAADKLLWASLSPDGRWLAAVGREQTVQLHPVDGGAGFPLSGHQQAVYKALFSPDSRQLATVSMDTTLRLWDLDAQAELFRLRLPTAFFTPSPLWDFDFRCTPTGCWLVVPLVRGALAVYNLGQWKE